MKTKKIHPREVIDLTDESEDTKRPRTVDIDHLRSLKTQVASLPHVIKRIEDLATPPEEYIRRAASTGNVVALTNLLKRFDCDLRGLVIAAARNNRLKFLQVLAQPFDDPEDDEHLLSIEGQELMKYGLGPAAANGHYEVVHFLWYASRDLERDPDDSMTEAFYQAASNGHRNILELIQGDLPTWDDNFAKHYLVAVSNAIARGYADVVEFLIGWEEYPCNAEWMFEVAMTHGKHDVARKICRAYKLHANVDLFVEMAGRGRMDTVWYMIEHRIADEKMVKEAIECAKKSNHGGVVDFLLGIRYVGT